MKLRALLYWSTAIFALCELAACDRANAPKIEQVACKPTSGSGAMIFLLDTGRKRVSWASGVRPVQANLVVRPYLYSFALRPRGVVIDIAIDRYTGAMALRRMPAGRLPIESWSCEKQLVGPKF
jgi:hypothetical protein